MLALPDASRILSCLRFTGCFCFARVRTSLARSSCPARLPTLLNVDIHGRTCWSRPSLCSLPAQELAGRGWRAPLNGCLLQFALWFQCSLFRRRTLSELTPRLCQVDVQQVVAMFCIVVLSVVRPLVIMATACSLSSFFPSHTHLLRISTGTSHVFTIRLACAPSFSKFSVRRSPNSGTVPCFLTCGVAPPRPWMLDRWRRF